ncbi:MAG: HAD family hydrolase [Bacteroidales bacterium]|nr:HAD family hydrolase [Bacteroidales bacterium]
MKYKLVIFDLDGTLVDTIADLGTAVNVALRARNLPEHTMEAYRGMVGHGVRNLVRSAMPEGMRGNEAALDDLLSLFLDYYIAHIDDLSRPYPGIPELLAELSAAGVKLAVASNKFQAGAEKLLRRTFPQIVFSTISGGRRDAPLKPDPAIVDGILERAGVCREEAVLVGDSATDIATAAAAGVACIAVSWGFRPKEALSAAGRIADSVPQLRGMLLES